MDRRYDIIVIGGGHAGTEAAWAAARMGVPTLLVTMSADAIGRMSCNPAIGGIGKGQMVREIDALGGLMGLATDRGGIQFRILNRRKGPAVWAPRAQADRVLYAKAVQELLSTAPNLSITEGSVESIDVGPPDAQSSADHIAPCSAVRSVTLADGRRFACRCAIITTGTFLRGLMHTGEEQVEGGRVGEATSRGLSATLEALGFELGRLKTGTPPRLARDSIDYDRLEVQPGDDAPRPFSFMNDAIRQPQVSCWITWTGEPAHELIRSNLHRAPMYSGQIVSVGPRYCPSIEDKVVRFAEKERHQIFLEPEGYDSDRIYCNGISTSLPRDVQEPMVRSIAGLENARIVQYGYAVEYDFVPPHQTRPTLETRRVAGLFLAGQINGTSGYEEAAGQGIVAGINAALRVLGREGAPAYVMRRDQGYIGVMIDDLVTRGTIEPYRMFTSRAEYRLLLRSDNADARLTPVGRELGLVDDARWRRFQVKQAIALAFEDWARSTRHNGRTWYEWIGRTDGEGLVEVDTVHFANSAHAAEVLTGAPSSLLNEAAEAVAIEARYEGYIRRQQREIDRFRLLESRAIPADFDYAALGQLRFEARERLAKSAPLTVGQAQRISGISPADVAVLLVYLERHLSGTGAAVPTSDQGHTAFPRTSPHKIGPR